VVTRRRQQFAWIAFAASIVLLLGAPVAAQEPGSPPAVTPSSAELITTLVQLEADLVDVDAAIATNATEVDAARRAAADANATYEAAVHRHDAAVEQLARYSVSAYIGGDAVETQLTDAVLHTTSLGLDAEARHALATTVRSELLAKARTTLTAYESATAALDRADATTATAEHRRDELAQQQDQVQADIDATRVAIVDAQNAERIAAEQARAKAAADAADAARARRLDLRPGTHRPLSAHTGVVPPVSVAPSVAAKFVNEIPPTALDAYWRAMSLTNASRPGCDIDWSLIAAIGKVETSHGTYGGTTVAADGSTSPTILGIPLDGSAGVVRINDSDGGVLDGDPEFDRAVGPMQFIPSTWRSFASDGNGDGIADPHNVYDAAVAAGTYLCHGAGGPISVPDNASRAVYAYNHSVQYNIEVLTLADHYRRVLDPNLPPITPPTVPPDPGELPPPANPGEPTTTTTSPDGTTTTTVAPPTTTP
jgi:membrane-bound lytic murein transglycosylase B